MNWTAGARAMACVIGALGLHCDSRKATNATPSVELEPIANAGSTASAEPPIATKDAGSLEWYACRHASECTVVPEGRCCTPCDPVAFQGYTAVNSQHRADF